MSSEDVAVCVRVLAHTLRAQMRMFDTAGGRARDRPTTGRVKAAVLIAVVPRARLPRRQSAVSSALPATPTHGGALLLRDKEAWTSPLWRVLAGPELSLASGLSSTAM
jgi:hypothetical protein